MKTLLLSCLSLVMLLATGCARTEHFVYFGSYTGAKSKGIDCWRMTRDGKLTRVGLAAEATSPSFLAVHPSQKFLYAIGEVSEFKGQKTGSVSAYAIDATTGKLTFLNQQTSGGPGPCHLDVDRAGKVVLVANYAGGSVQALPIKEDGSLGEPGTFVQHKGTGDYEKRAPRGHAINVDPTQRYAVVCDLGLDQVLVYKLDAANAKLTPNNPPFAMVAPGSGPRHLAFRPDGKFAYVINETLLTMTAFAWDGALGELKEVQTLSTLPAAREKGFSTAEVYVHPSGKFVYGSNRGHDSIVVYASDEKTGKLTLVEHQNTQGRTPRHFAIHPSGNFLLAENQSTDNVVVFRIDPQTGKLTATGEKIEVGSPVCAVFVPVK
jgi:6-phosphogluconolactonase